MLPAEMLKNLLHSSREIDKTWRCFVLPNGREESLSAARSDSTPPLQV